MGKPTPTRPGRVGQQMAVDLAPELFDAARYPRLRRQCQTQFRGLCTLLEVNETSDGFLMGWARFEHGPDVFEHSIFLGAVSNFRDV